MWAVEGSDCYVFWSALYFDPFSFQLLMLFTAGVICCVLWYFSETRIPISLPELFAHGLSIHLYLGGGG